ncbi:MAG TPA: hypothetical protein EYH42_10310 [Sulfurovum sp.]|nr:hypothetical protein [Sulfurovum sp.]
MFQKQYLAYMIVFMVIALNILIYDNMMIPLAIVAVVFTLTILTGIYREHRWTKQVLELF